MSVQTPWQFSTLEFFCLSVLALASPPAQVAIVAAQCDRVVASESVTRRYLEAVMGLLNLAGPLLSLGRLFKSAGFEENGTTLWRLLSPVRLNPRTYFPCGTMGPRRVLD